MEGILPLLQAADEMKERLATMLGEEVAKKLFAGTFHGWVGGWQGRGLRGSIAAQLTHQSLAGERLGSVQPWSCSFGRCSGRACSHPSPCYWCSLCYRILKSHIRDLEHAGRDSSFTVYDQVRCCQQ